MIILLFTNFQAFEILLTLKHCFTKLILFSQKTFEMEKFIVYKYLIVKVAEL